MAAGELKTHGITTETVKNMILNACAVYKNVKYEGGKWQGEPLGATSGGTKFNWEKTWLDIEVDGATVLVKGVSKQLVGEAAYIEANMTELTEQILADALYLEKDTVTQYEGFTAYKSKGNITDKDYLENIALFGTKSDGKKVLIILPNAICTEAFELETKNAEQSVFKVKFESTADPASGNLNKLDVKIIFEGGAAAAAASTFSAKEGKEVIK